MVKTYTRFQTKTAQEPYTLWAAHTYTADMGKYPLPPRVLPRQNVSDWHVSEAVTR